MTGLSTQRGQIPILIRKIPIYCRNKSRNLKSRKIIISRRPHPGYHRPDLNSEKKVSAYFFRSVHFPDRLVSLISSLGIWGSKLQIRSRRRDKYGKNPEKFYGRRPPINTSLGQITRKR